MKCLHAALRNTLTFVLLGFCLLATADFATAQAMRAGFDATFTIPCDDAYFYVPLGFTVNFFGNKYDHVYCNNNGNITFDSGFGGYQPTFTGLGTGMIAPFFADVDTGGAKVDPVTGRITPYYYGGKLYYIDVMRYGAGTVDGHNAFWSDMGRGRNVSL